MIVTRTDLMDALGVNNNKITTLTNRGIIKPISRGKYDLAECIAAYIEVSVEDTLKQMEKGSGKKDTTESLDFWKMQRQKSAALKEMGVLMSADAAEKLMSSRLTQIRNVLNTVDSTWAPYLVGVKTVEGAQKILTEQLDKMFEQLSTLQDFGDEEEEVPLETENDEVTQDSEEDDVYDDEVISDEE